MERLPALMREVLAYKPDVLVTHSTPGAVAAKNATSTVPIVNAGIGDPIGTGIVPSLAHPGGNLTGLSLEWSGGITGKWLELLHETIPRLSTVAVISQPDSPLNKVLVKELKKDGATLGIKLRFIDVREPEDLDRAFEQVLGSMRVGAERVRHSQRPGGMRNFYDRATAWRLDRQFGYDRTRRSSTT